jgi:hypothetical protein
MVDAEAGRPMTALLIAAAYMAVILAALNVALAFDPGHDAERAGA